jgi:tetratricopeptide (TPR) repeat protein
MSIYLGLILLGTPIVQTLSLNPAQAETAPTAVREGYTLLGKGLVNDAIAVFRRAVAENSQSIEAKLGLAIAYRRAGKDADAWQMYLQVLAQDPNNQLALRTVGILGGYRPEWQSTGIEALTRLLSLAPGDVDALAQRALLYSYQGRFAESLADYQIVLQRNPSPEAVLNAAQVYTYTKNYRQALDLFSRYRSTGKAITGSAAIAYAQVLRETGNPAQAIQILQSSLPKQFNKTAIDILSELSQAYLANGQVNEAIAVLNSLQGRSDAQLSLARALNEIGRKQSLSSYRAQAAVLYRQVLAQTPNPSFGLVREVADVVSGLPSEKTYALQLYRWLAQQQPNDRAIAIQQLALENQLGFLSRINLRQRLLALLQPLPTDPAQQLAIAQALVRVEPDPELLPIYQTLIQTGVNEPFLNFRLAQILVERNNFEAARSALAVYRSTMAGARDQAPELLLAEMERRQGNLEASAQRYQALLSPNQTDSDVATAALQGLASVRLAQGRSDQALALYDQLLARNPQDLKTQLGWAAVAYQSKRISEAQAEALLYTWLQSHPATDTPPELYSLVGALPPSPQRESLYVALTQANPSYIPIQVRLVQVLASRDLTQAQTYVNQVLAQVQATNPDSTNNADLLFLQGQLAQAVGDRGKAEEAYKAILAFQPKNVNALSALGGIRFQQRQFDAATQLYSQVLSLNPSDQTARMSLAELTAAEGYTFNSIQQLEQMQIQQTMAGVPSSDISRRIQLLQEDLLRQRGFQPSWERYR